MANQKRTDTQSKRFQKFLFKGHAIALTGSVRKPYYQSLGEHAAVRTLAGSAGHGTARNEGFALGNDITYGAVYSKITAERSNNIFHAVMETTIENLRVRGKRFTAERIVARLEAMYDASTYPHQKVSRILPTGSKFVNIKVNGEEYKPKVPPAFDLSEKERREFFEGKRDGDSKFYPGKIANPLVVPNFGVIYFAEWVWVHPDEQEEQSLTMFRMSLGSEFGVEIDGGRAGGNGSGWPP